MRTCDGTDCTSHSKPCHWWQLIHDDEKLLFCSPACLIGYTAGLVEDRR